MFWTKKKRNPQPIKTISQTLNETENNIWKNDYILTIETDIQTSDTKIKGSMPNLSDNKTIHTYRYTIALYKEKPNIYLLTLDRVPIPQKNKKTRTAIEELSQQIGKHTNTIIYQIDAVTAQPISIYNYNELVKLWQVDKKIIEDYYTDNPAQILTEIADKQITNQKLYTQSLYHIFPNALLIGTYCAYYQPLKSPTPFTINLLPNDNQTLPITITKKTSDQFSYTAQTHTELDAEATKNMFLPKHILTKQNYTLQTNLHCTVNLQPKTEAWEKINCTIEVDCHDIYYKKIKLNLSKIDRKR